MGPARSVRAAGHVGPSRERRVRDVCFELTGQGDFTHTPASGRTNVLTQGEVSCLVSGTRVRPLALPEKYGLLIFALLYGSETFLEVFVLVLPRING